MKQIVNIKGVDVVYDIDELTSQIWEKEYDKTAWEDKTEDEDDGSYTMTLEEFNEAKNNLADEISNLDSTIEKMFTSNIYITKANKLAKNRKNVVHQSDMYTLSYINEYGTHIYYAMCLIAVDRNTHVEIVLDEVNFQD